VSSPDNCLDNPKYYSYIAVLALMATTMLVQVSHMVKLTLMLLITVATGIVNIYSWRDIFDRYDVARFQDYRRVARTGYSGKQNGFMWKLSC